ncbi:MAG: hypothetical protein H0U66_18070 [Gemmatimonadaceae bacterium]|nr:hypothetical protein [Gemmatimonadaceae bacterium]
MRADRRGSGWRIVVLAGGLLCAALVREAAASDDPRIARIRSWFAATEKALPRYRIVRRDLAEFSAQGAVLTAYFAGDTLRKLNGAYYAEGNRTTDDIYIRDDSVYFVSHIVGKYFLSVDGQLIHRVQYRMYFDHDSLIRWIDTTGKDRPLKTAEADSAARRDLNVARILIECARLEGPAQSCLVPRADSAPPLAK